MNLSVISEDRPFADLHAEWDALLQRSRGGNPFLSHEWLYSWWQVYGQGQLYLLLCRDRRSGELLGLLPAYLSPRGGLRTPELRLLGSRRVTSDFLGSLAVPEREAEIQRRFLEHLQQQGRSWSFLQLTDLAEDNPLTRYLAAGAGLPLRFFRRREAKPCPCIPLPKDWEAYLQGLTANMRRKIRARRRRLAGTARLELVGRPEELDQALADLARLHRQRRQAKGDRGLFDDPDFAAFHRLVCRRFLARGWLQLAFLRYRGRRVACVYQYRYADRVYYYQTGFDPDYAELSVGFVLLGMLIERAIGEGLRSYEFLRGAEPYKADWGGRPEQQLCDLVCSNANWFNRLELGGRLLGADLKGRLKRRLPPALITLLAAWRRGEPEIPSLLDRPGRAQLRRSGQGGS